MTLYTFKKSTNKGSSAKSCLVMGADGSGTPRKRQPWPKCPQSHFPLDLCERESTADEFDAMWKIALTCRVLTLQHYPSHFANWTSAVLHF
ncbi:hypothetical protein TNCV_1950711 [Trichonephila clavipes]|nr:hypothetical protein TNCV_1950711 [Trichonephila clavipes]